MPVIHNTDLVEVRVDDENPNILYVRHKNNRNIEFILWPENEVQGGRPALIVEPAVGSKMEIDVNGTQPQVVIVPV